MKKLILLISIFVCSITTLSAQTSGNNCVGFISNIEPTVLELSEQQERSLKLKVDQIITRNKVATTALYNAFIITPHIDILSSESVNVGLRPVTQYIAEVTLIASNSVDKSVYGSITVEVRASGNTEEKAISSIITSIRPTDPRFTKFINSAVTQITNYYSANMPTILRKTETFLSAKKYDDAIIFLESIPTCIPAYEMSSDAIQGLYALVADKDCHVAVNMAQRLIALGDYNKAKKVLLDIEPGSECDDAINQLAAVVGDSVRVQKSLKDSIKTSQTNNTTATTTTTTSSSNNYGVVKSNLKNFDVTLVSTQAYPTNNKLEVTLLIKNKSELSQRLRLTTNGSDTFLYSNNGDTFYCNHISDYDFTLLTGMPRKVTFTFDRIATSNTTLSGIITLYDSEGNNKIEISNMNVKW